MPVPLVNALLLALQQLTAQILALEALGRLGELVMEPVIAFTLQRTVLLRHLLTLIARRYALLKLLNLL